VTVGSVLLIVVAVVLLALGLGQGSDLYLVGSIAASLLAAVGLIVYSRQATGAAVPEETEAGLDDLVEGAAASTVAYAGQGSQDDVQGGRTATVTERAPTRQPTFVDPRGEGLLRDEPRVVEPEGDVLAVGRSDQPAEPRIAEPPARHPLLADAVIPTQSVAADMDRLGDLPAQEPELHDVDLSDEPAAEQMSPAEAAQLATMITHVLVVDGRPRYHLVGCAHLLSRESESLPVGEAVELGFTPCAACQPNVKLLQEAPRP
jgi:hypothetical protein